MPAGITRSYGDRMFMLAVDWSGLMLGIQKVGDVLLAIAPALIVLSFATSALMWVMAGSSTRMAKRAQDQFKATCVTTLIIGGYFTMKALAGFMLGGTLF